MSTSSHHQAIVVGSGIGGLAAALRLAQKGYSVEVFEKNPYIGGKMHAVEQDGYRFDLGPSLFTLPHLVVELHDLFPEIEVPFHFIKKETACHYFWEDGTRFDAPGESERFVREGAKTFEVDGDLLARYLAKSKRKFELTRGLFLERSLHRLSTYLRWDTVRALLHMPMMDIGRTLDQVNQDLHHPKLRQLFNRYATYNGSSPYQTPGIMSMIPHLEFGIGTYYPDGGMHEIPRSLQRLAEQVGVRIHVDSPVERILHDGRRVTGIALADGTRTADIVVCNADIVPTYRYLLPDLKAPEATLQQERSSSAMIFYWGMDRNYDALDLHNIFFTEDYGAEFGHLFHEKTPYDDPTVYVNITSKETPSDAPPGGENWFVMINAPADYGQPWAELADQCRSAVIAKLERCLGQAVADHIVTSFVMTPADIATKTSSYQGALYGAASHSKMSAFLRHQNKGRLRGLYHVGGSVHPGGGIPLALLSARIACDLIPSAR